MNDLMERKIIVSAEQKALVKSIVFPGCSDNEMALYLFECERRGVHPLDRVIFPISRNDSASGGKKLTFQCGIDFFRSEAADTGEYDGQDEPVFGDKNKDGFPEFATVSVYKKGIDRPFTGTARWSEFYPGEKQGFMWRKMPFHMLSKCAEVLALRKAFPKRLSGLYIPEEMGSPDTVKPPVRPPQKKPDASEPTTNNQAGSPQKQEVKNPDDPATEPQVKAIQTLFGKLGIKDDFEKHSKASRMAGIPEPEVITSFTLLTKGQASKVIEALMAEGTQVNG
ncbi:MAG: recombinase RecT [Smithellaceae bacterium]|jgi:phage recombination protein Bet